MHSMQAGARLQLVVLARLTCACTADHMSRFLLRATPLWVRPQLLSSCRISSPLLSSHMPRGSLEPGGRKSGVAHDKPMCWAMWAGNTAWLHNVRTATGAGRGAGTGRTRRCRQRCGREPSQLRQGMAVLVRRLTEAGAEVAEEVASHQGGGAGSHLGQSGRHPQQIPSIKQRGLRAEVKREARGPGQGRKARLSLGLGDARTGGAASKPKRLLLQPCRVSLAAAHLLGDELASYVP
jgi:hypothetical protein